MRIIEPVLNIRDKQRSYVVVTRKAVKVVSPNSEQPATCYEDACAMCNFLNVDISV